MVAVEDGDATAEAHDTASYWRESDVLAETTATRLRALARLDVALPGMLDRVLPRGGDAAGWQMPIAWHLCTPAQRMSPGRITSLRWPLPCPPSSGGGRRCRLACSPALVPPC